MRRFTSLETPEARGRRKPICRNARGLWIDPTSSKDQRDIYISGNHGFMVRLGGRWEKRPAPPKVVFNDVSAGFSPETGAVLYATSETGILVSTDRGTSWTSPTLGGQGAQVRAIATSLRHPEVAYVSYWNLPLEGKTWVGVARTRDAGHTWALVWKEGDTAPSNVHDAWITEELGRLGRASFDAECRGAGCKSNLLHRLGSTRSHTTEERIGQDIFQTGSRRKLDYQGARRYQVLWLLLRSV